MILSVTLNPSVDRTLFTEGIKISDVNRVLSSETDAGGKGINVVRVAAELGAECTAIGFLGGAPGAMIKDVLNRQGVKHDFIEVEQDTRLNVIVEYGTGRPPTSFNEAGPTITPELWEQMLAKCREWAPKAAWVTVGGSLPPGVPKEAYGTLVKLFKDAGCKVVLDADNEPLRFGLASGPDFIKPNANEAERLLLKPVRSRKEAAYASDYLHNQGTPIVVISRGAAGAAVACSEGIYDAEPPTVKAKSTIGSGDSMIGAMLYAFEKGMSVVQAFGLGVAAGAATASTSGAEIARRPIVEQLIPDVKIRKVDLSALS